MSEDDARMFAEARCAEQVWTGGQPTSEAVVEAHNEAMGMASEKTRYILTHPWRFHCGFILCDQSVGKSHVVVCCNDSHLADHVVALHNASLQAFDPDAAREQETA